MAVLRLITIPISHYCEKARWALQYAGLEYREEPHVQGVHRIYARRAGGAGTVPVLVTPDGAIGESEQILEFCDRSLPRERSLFGGEPERAEVLALCRRFDAVLGPSARRLIYVHMFAQPERALRYNNQGVPGWEDRAIRHGVPLMRRVVGQALGIRPGIELADEATVWREFDMVAGLLSDGRAHLLGDRFTAADLTFGALASAVLLPAVYGWTLPRPQDLDAGTAAIISRAREHPAGPTRCSSAPTGSSSGPGDVGRFGQCPCLAPAINSRRMVTGGGTTIDAAGGHRAPSDGPPSLPAVRLQGIRKTYGDVVAIEDLSLEVHEGEFFTMLGPSGSGKTTTLRVIAGFESADAGCVELHGADVTNSPPYERAVNTVFQDSPCSRT